MPDSALQAALDAGSTFPHLHDGEWYVGVMYEDGSLDMALSWTEEDAREWMGPWRDKHGDIWQVGADGLMHSHETAPFPREHVEKKWGPLVPHSSEPESTDAD